MPRHTESRPGRLLQKGKEKAVPSDDKSTAHVETLNTLLNQIHVPIRLAALQDVVPSLWVALFEGLFQTRIPSIVRDSQTQSAKINNVKEVLKALGEAVGTELSHIQAEEVVAGGWGVADLVEVFGEVGRVLREDGPPAPRRTDESGWTEVSGDEADEQQPELDEKSRLPHHRPHGKSRSAAYPKTSTPLPLSPPKESHRSPSPHPSKASAIHLRGSPSRKENKTERPKRRRLRSGGETGILTDVKDDVEEYLQENMFAENKSSDGGWIDEIDEDVQTDRTPRAVKRHDNDQNRVPKASPTRKRQPQTPAVLKIHATDTPYTRALKRRRARIIREAQTPSPVKARGVSKIPNRGFIVRDRAPSPEQSGGPSHRQASPTRSANHKASEHSSEEGDTPQPITNLRTFESMIRTALPGAPLPAGARARAWDQQLKVHDRALKDRVWDRRSQRPRTTVEQEVKPLITGARRLAEDIALVSLLFV
ncbi:hypothetical protein DFS34DRAFT_238979 [Phlyctochytrium arcticum]|nr:hypothetical protein DFS34DRAFT_238979 [Phlyctochytrium arcticum]